MTVASAAVVAVAFRASMQTHLTVGGAAVVSSASPVARPSPRPSSPGHRTPRPPTAGAGTGQASAVVVTGGVVDTQYGPVQVEITVRGGRITRSHAVQHPSGDGRTDQINSFAVPQLDHETVTVQSARIDTVSGATFTSEGYRQSLQSALDAAHQAGAR
ncbi:FMN-binding protein [Kribbella sindirgiensis]|uniref:FMN-binding protein n=2 Tax=Kribbella sindirgiensis TaxID=1124744 RepID=A0A4R0I7U5_9ACTN|nr:FMN-binding protein [Kribbella sindirgiensis]